MHTLARITAAVLIGELAWMATALSNPATSAAAETGKVAATASLVDKDAKAKQKAAVVEVDVTGVKLVDPATSQEKAVAGQGHLHYQVDTGPIIATPASKLAFHGLPPGKHTITVYVAGNDHAALTPAQVLELQVP
jgi:hypothetical protein